MIKTLQLTDQESTLIATILANDQSRIKGLIARLNLPANNLFASTESICSPPPPGQPWPEQGGIYAGVLPAIEGEGIEHLVIGDWLQGEFIWGNSSKDITGASSRTDGKLNTTAMLAAGSPAAQALQRINIEAGLKHDDWHIPSQQEAATLAVTCFDHMGGAVMWTSSQCSAHYAWYQSFDTGRSGWDLKSSSSRVRPVRRFKF